MISAMATRNTDLEGYVCLVTGASRGIGRGIALALGELGATVYITARSLRGSGDSTVGTLEETASEISKRGGVSFLFFNYIFEQVMVLSNMITDQEMT